MWGVDRKGNRAYSSNTIIEMRQSVTPKIKSWLNGCMSVEERGLENQPMASAMAG